VEKSTEVLHLHRLVREAHVEHHYQFMVRL
jgi:hypothetical protein